MFSNVLASDFGLSDFIYSCQTLANPRTKWPSHASNPPFGSLFFATPPLRVTESISGKEIKADGQVIHVCSRNMGHRLLYIWDTGSTIQHQYVSRRLRVLIAFN